jgi:hypothetical protein
MICENCLKAGEENSLQPSQACYTLAREVSRMRMPAQDWSRVRKNEKL